MSFDMQQSMSSIAREAGRRARSPAENESADFGLDEMQERTDEPSRRRRIPRACESCRKRKIRCNGKEVCASCQASSLMCVYRDDGSKYVKEHMQQFDARLQRMESVLAEFMAKLEAVQSQAPVTTERRRSSVESESVIETESEGINSNGKRPAEREPEGVECPPSPPLSHAQDAPSQAQRGSTTEASVAKRQKTGRRGLRGRPTYADAYGELHADEWNQLRYIGLSSTISVIDICMPFREHINRGLEKKGYYPHNDFLGPSVSVCEAVTLQSAASGSSDSSSSSNGNSPDLFAYGHVPPAALTKILVQCFYERVYYIRPVISRHDLESQLADIDGSATASLDSDFLPVLYGLLSVAALNLPKESLEGDATLAAYRTVDLGASYYALSSSPQPAQRCRPRRGLNPVIALVLQAEYLAATGSQAEAWITIGQAVRLGQDLGLHRSASQLGFGCIMQDRRRYAWWCIYSLDRALSAALGRPLAIRDADCDIELPPDADGNAGFSAILNLRRILGDILTTVASVRTVKASRHVSKTREVQAIILGLNAELQTWASKEVPDSVKAAAEGQLAVEKFIALSGHFGALLLLYRFFITNPHRASPLHGNEALMQCARAATNCIRITPKIVTLMPVCADLVFHIQYVFTSSVVLLQCIRRSDDAGFIQEALHDVEQAARCLRSLQQHWAGATRLLALVEEYVEFTLRFMESGVTSSCAFHHDVSEFTGLETRDGSSRYPSDWAQLAFKRLPIGPGSRHCSDHDHDHDHDHNQTATSPFDPNLFRFSLPQQRPSTPMATTVVAPRDDGPSRSWGVGAGVLDMSFESFWISDVDDSAFLTGAGDGNWGFQ